MDIYQHFAAFIKRVFIKNLTTASGGRMGCGMIHIKEDAAVTLCGITGKLPDGHVFFFAGENGARRATCPKCNPEGPTPIGTPISQLSGRPGEPGFDRFCEIAESWGY